MVHECLHIVFAPISEIAGRRFVSQGELSDAEEAAVDHLSIVIHNMMQDQRKLAKKIKP